MTALLQAASFAERNTAVVIGGSVLSLNPFTDNLLPVELAPILEFSVIFLAVDVEGFWHEAVGLCACCFHYYFRAET